MNRPALISILFFLSIASALPAQDIKWVRHMSAATAEFANAVLADSDGNFYISGYFGGNLNFGGQSLSGSGIGDVFIAKYSSSGGLDWVKQGTSSGWNGGRGIALDGNGNVFVTGRIQGTVSFDGEMATSVSENDPFITKYSPEGAIQWVRSGGGSGDDWGQSVAVDAEGNSYGVGSMGSGITFSGTSLFSAGAEDAYLVSYDANGTLKWAKSGGGNGTDVAYGVATDLKGNIYVVGEFSGTATFSGTTINGSPNGTGFLASYDSDGGLRWVKSLNGTTIAEKVSVDSDGNIYAVGAFLGTTTFGSTTLTSAGAEDIFVARYDADGSPLAAWQVGGSGRDGVAGFGQSSQVTPGVGGGFFLASSFENSVVIGEETLTSEGDRDVLIARFDQEGNPLWARRGGGSDFEGYVGVGVDGVNTAYLFGNFFSGTFRFGTAQLFRSGLTDMFLAKISAEGEEQPKISISPVSLAFGQVAVGLAATEEIRVQPANNAGLVVQDIYFDDPESGNKGFSIESPTSDGFPIELKGSSRLDVVIRFLPQDESNVSTTIVVETNDPVNPKMEVQIGGEGVDANSLPSALLSANRIDIGTVWIGSEGTGSLTISPANSAGLIVQSVEFDDPDSFDKGFELVAPADGILPEPLNDGESIQITVRYTALESAEAQTSLIIKTNDGLNPETEIPVTASGAIAPVAQLSRFNLDFGDVETGKAATQLLTVNPGNASNLLINSISISGADASSYKVLAPDDTTTYPIRLQEGDDLIVEIEFAPENEGTQKATVTLGTNDPLLEEAEVSLSGVGTKSSSGITHYGNDQGEEIVKIMPNPLQEESVVVLNMKNSAHVRISLFDVAGQLIREMFDEQLEKGEQRVVIDGQYLVAGIYICMIEIDNQRYHRVVTKGM